MVVALEQRLEDTERQRRMEIKETWKVKWNGIVEWCAQDDPVGYESEPGMISGEGKWRSEDSRRYRMLGLVGRENWMDERGDEGYHTRQNSEEVMVDEDREVKRNYGNGDDDGKNIHLQIDGGLVVTRAE